MKRFTVLAALAVLVSCGDVAPPPHDATGVKLPDVGPAQPIPSAMPAALGESDVTVPIDDDDAVWGSRMAPVTIVEFSDFQCPFCSRAETTLSQLRTEYGPERLRIVFKNEPLPFHQNARPAAEAGAAIHALGGDAAFWRFHELAFKNQALLSPESYEGWAQKAGVSLAAFRDAVHSARTVAAVDRDMAAAKQLGVNGTPAFYINGASLSGAQPIDKFRSVIEEAQKQAQAAIEKGTPKDGVYRAMVTANYKVPSPDDDDDAPAPDTAVWKVPVGTSPARGPLTALVTIVEFSDFQCPFCGRVEPTLADLRVQYGDKIRIVWKNEPLPFHPRANPAALFALEARAQKGDAGFWDAHDKLFASQPNLEDADLDKIGTAMGLNLTKTHAAVTTKKYQQTIDSDNDLSDDLQASGTPHFFINGRRLVGAQPKDKFVAMIDDEIKKAQALVAAGTKPEAVYAETIKNGKEAPAPSKLAIALRPGAPAKGASVPVVTISEFADFQCPYCQRADAALAEVLKNYPNNVKIEWHDMPLSFHQNAHLAAEAAMAVFKLKGRDAFWRYHDALFGNQGVQGGLERPELERFATAEGVDIVKFRAALDQSLYAAAVDADAKTATDAGISGTPAFVINGYLVSGAQPYAKFRKTIEIALRDAAAAKASGRP